MGDDITIGVTEIVNNIEVTAQPNDQIVDISITDNSDEVTLNITPTVVEVNINKGGSFAKWGDLYGTLSDQTDLQNALNLKANLVGGKVPASELPSYVDDIIEVANYAALPATGEIGKIYVTLDNNKIYRWSGSVYIEIASNSAIWGAITGTLSSQTDLQNALNAKEPTITAGTTSQYWRGDKSWQTLDSSSVGLGNVNNTSDADKPISTATQTALNAKQAALSGTGFVKISGTTISYDSTTYLSGTVAIANGGTGATTAGAARTNLGATTVGANIFTIPNPNPVTKAYIRANADNTVEWLDGNAFRESIGAGTGNGTVTSVNGTGGYGGLTLTGTVTGSGDLTLGGTPEGTWGISITGNAASVNTVQVSTNADFYLTFADANNGSPTAEFLYTIGTIKVNPSTGALTAGSFVKSGGTSSQFLMADGSVSTGSGGTVTSVAAITLGTTGTDLSSTVANGTTTPVITLNVPTASATNRGALSAADWTTFNNKQNALTNPVTGTGTTNYIPKFTGASAIGNSSIFDNGQVNIGSTSFAGDELLMVSMNGTTNSQAINVKDRNASANASTFMVFRKSDDTFLGNIRRSGTSDALYIGGNSFLALGVGGNTEAMRIFSNGNTFIGASPTDAGYKLDVNGTGRFSGEIQATRFFSIGSLNNTNGSFLIDHSGVNTWKIGITNSNTSTFSIGNDNGGSFASKIFNIASGGDVGIGTLNNYSSKLSVLISDATSTLSGVKTSLRLMNDGSGRIAKLLFTDNTISDATICFIPAGGGNSTLSFGIQGTTVNYQTLNIKENGNVLIGTTTDAGYKLDVNGYVRIQQQLLLGNFNGEALKLQSATSTGNSYLRFYNSAGTSRGYLGLFWNGSSDYMLYDTGSLEMQFSTSNKYTFNGAAATFASTVTATGFFNSSDNRLKDLIDYDYNVSDIKPITYLWKDGRDNKKHVGYSAQEVQKVMPDAVNEDEKGFLSVNYVEVLVAQVELLNNRMAEMQKEIELLKSK